MNERINKRNKSWGENKITFIDLFAGIGGFHLAISCRSKNCRESGRDGNCLDSVSLVCGDCWVKECNKCIKCRQAKHLDDSRLCQECRPNKSTCENCEVCHKKSKVNKFTCDDNGCQRYWLLKDEMKTKESLENFLAKCSKCGTKDKDKREQYCSKCYQEIRFVKCDKCGGKWDGFSACPCVLNEVFGSDKKLAVCKKGHWQPLGFDGSDCQTCAQWERINDQAQMSRETVEWERKTNEWIRTHRLPVCPCCHYDISLAKDANINGDLTIEYIRSALKHITNCQVAPNKLKDKAQMELISLLSQRFNGGRPSFQSSSLSEQINQGVLGNKKKNYNDSNSSNNKSSNGSPLIFLGIILAVAIIGWIYWLWRRSKKKIS